jgi:hypothetical protein
MFQNMLFIENHKYNIKILKRKICYFISRSFTKPYTFQRFGVLLDTIERSQRARDPIDSLLRRCFLIVYFNLVQYFTTNGFSIKEQKIYNDKYTYHTYFSPENPNRENQHILYSFIVIHCLQYNIHIGAASIQNPNPMTWISQQP